MKTILVLLSGLLTLTLTSCTSGDNVIVTYLSCEYITNPIGLDIKQPRFCWILESSIRGQRQTAYQILVAASKEMLNKNSGDMWDSGRIESNQSTHLLYKGIPLKSNQTYYYKVRVWDRDGNPSKYSEIAQFSMALLNPSDWQAKWIGIGPEKEPKTEKGYFDSPSDQEGLEDTVTVDSRSHLLRKEVVLDKPIRLARVYACGLGLYELRINGKKVGDKVLNPAKTHYRKQVLYDTYDVTELVQKGDNAIGMMLGNGWFNPAKKWWSWRMQWFGAKRAIMQMHIDYADGTNQIITTDETWKATTGPIVNSCIYDGEIYDANLEKPGWDKVNYDDSAWENVNIVEAPGGKLISQMMEPIKVNEIIEPVAVTNPKPDAYIYDMGQNFTGWVRLSIKGKKGTKVVLRYAENLGEDGSIDVMSNNLAQSTDYYIMKGEGIEVYEPHFTYHGFRYVEVTGYPNLPHIENLQGCVVHSACRSIGNFECGNKVINHIRRCTLWSQRSNMTGYPTDCPQRDERLGWMGDAHVTAEEAMHNFHMPLFYRNWLSGIQANQDKTGDIPYISPRPYMEPGTPAWSSAYPLIIWYYYLHYCDVQILGEHFDSIKRYVDFLSSKATDYILPKDRYGDWVSVAEGWKRGEPESVATAYFYYNAIIVSKAAKVLGLLDDARHYAKLAEQIKDAYNDRFFVPVTKQYENGSQMSNAFPLFLNIVPENHKKVVLKNLVDDIVVKHQGRLTTGILGTKYMIELLTNEGQTDIAYLLATQTDYPGWYDMVKNRTTLSEHWDQGGSNNHVMFGSIDAWFYRALVGINVDEAHPGFEHIIIKPFIQPELSWAKAWLETVRGKVSSGWEYRDGVCKLNITIPVNTTATVYVLAQNAESVTESGKPAETSPGVRFLRMEGNHAVYEIGSGSYKFISENVQGLGAKPFTAKPEIFPKETFISIPETVTINLTCATKGAVIHYTLDGSEPTESSPRYQQTFSLKKSTLVKAKAFKAGYRPSFTQSVLFSFVDAQKNGLEYELYRGEFIRLPDFQILKPSKSGRVYQFGLSEIETPKYNFALRFCGFIEIPQEGEYTFYTCSNDGSQLFINNQLIVDNDGEHGVEEQSGKIDLRPGKYPIKVTYFQSGGTIALKVLYKGPGVEKQIIPASVLYQDGVESRRLKPKE